MPSRDSITKTIRLNKEDREYIEELMRDNGITWNRAVHRAIRIADSEKECGRQDLMDRAVERDIIKECKRSGISTHDFFRGIEELWKKGKIEIDGYRVKSVGEWDMKEFEICCWKNKKSPQKVIDMITEKLRD